MNVSDFQDIGLRSLPTALRALSWAIVLAIVVTIVDSGLSMLGGEGLLGDSGGGGASNFAPTTASKTVTAAALSSAGQGSAGDIHSRIDTLLARAIFGKLQAEVTPRQAAAPTTQTRLPLELNAVFVSTRQQQSGAIVAQKGKSGVLYGIGDVLPGNARLVEVRQEEIILNRAGSLESLRFAEDRYQASRAATSDAAKKTAAGPSKAKAQPLVATNRAKSLQQNAVSSTQVAEELREAFAENDQGRLAKFGLEQNQGRGYRVGKLSQNPYFQKSGLQAGDIILSVNGQPAGDLSKDKMEIDNILAQGSASIEIERNGSRIVITASIPQ